MTKPDMRRESRLAEEMVVQLLTFSTPEGKQNPNQFKIIRTIDISAGGMQIELNARIPVKSVLQLRLQPKNGQKSFKLKGEVRWTYQDRLDANRHYIGFRLLDEDRGDNSDWSDYVTARMKMQALKNL